MALEPEYKVEASSRRCDTCDRTFAPGQGYYSAVVETDEEHRFARRDFCPACWEARGPDDAEFFSFWKTRVPEPKEVERGPRLIDLERLVGLFERLGDPDRAEDLESQRFRYVLALALMRKRRLRLVSSRRLPKGRGEEMTLREVGGDRTHVVAGPALSEEEVAGVAERLREILDMPERWDRPEPNHEA